MDSHNQYAFLHQSPNPNVRPHNVPREQRHGAALQRDPFHNTRRDHQAYPHVFDDQPPPVPPAVAYTHHDFWLSVDSRDRDRTKYPNPSQYVINLIEADGNARGSHVPGLLYRNVERIELASAIIPNRNNVLNEPYLLLTIDELGCVYEATSEPVSAAFTKLMFVNPGAADGRFLRLDRGIGEPFYKDFSPAPLASLGKITLSIRRPDGTLFNFGTDTKEPVAPNPELQNSFTFRITTRGVDPGALMGRNPGLSTV